MHSASRSDIQRARRLRTEMTDAEVRLWIQLRRRQIDGYRFRRQVPIGPYVVDFACLNARLVIEVDGGQHTEAVERDDRRTVWLESRGFRVLRFWNTDVLQRTEGVLESIRATLLGLPPLHSPQSKGGTEDPRLKPVGPSLERSQHRSQPAEGRLLASRTVRTGLTGGRPLRRRRQPISGAGLSAIWRRRG